MTFGFLYYAHNNDAVNYLKLAICSILSGQYHIKDFECQIVTDSESIKSLDFSDQIILSRICKNITIDNNYKHKKENYRNFFSANKNAGKQLWHNKTRPNAYNDSIFDETILIDVDFIFQDSNLKNLQGSNQSIMMNKDFICLLSDKRVNDINFITKEKLGNFSIPMFWATVVYFKKDSFAKEFFDVVNDIQDNYFYYQKLYQVDDSSYRNDYAFTIALHKMNGFKLPGKEYEIPYKFALMTQLDELFRVDPSSTKVIVDNRDPKLPYLLLNIENISYHCLNKFTLLIKYQQFLKAYNK